jgi:hypothetical protein
VRALSSPAAPVSRRLRGLVGLVATVLAACSALPEHARPRVELMDSAAYRPLDVIRYRQISREDFRADSPPESVAEHAAASGAYTCANLVPDAETQVRVVATREPGTYLATLVEARFHAEMDRACSWWNPRGTRLPSAYVLQHEQIHFALVEIHARRLSAEVQRLRLETDSPRSAHQELQRRYDALVRAAVARLLRDNTDFDEDTSARYEPERQSRWLARVQAELASAR